MASNRTQSLPHWCNNHNLFITTQILWINQTVYWYWNSNNEVKLMQMINWLVGCWFGIRGPQIDCYESHVWCVVFDLLDFQVGGKEARIVPHCIGKNCPLEQHIKVVNVRVNNYWPLYVSWQWTYNSCTQNKWDYSALLLHLFCLIVISANNYHRKHFHFCFQTDKKEHNERITKQETNKHFWMNIKNER